MPNYKGGAVVFIRKKFQERGKTAEKEFLDQLEKEVALTYLSVLPSSWVPLQIAEKIMWTSAQVLYPGDEKALQHLGYDRAKDHLTGIYRVLLKISTPAFVINQSTKIWKMYYDTGEAKANIASFRKYAEMIVRDFPELPITFREITSGYITAAMDLTGAKQISLQRDDVNPNAWRWYGSWE